MTHTTEGANSLIKVAALVVGGLYAYRRFTEGTAEEVKASRAIPPVGQFVIAWSVVFLGLSLAAGPAPTLAGNMALLVMIASLLSNGVQISKDIRGGMAASVAQREAAVAAAHPGRRPSPSPRGSSSQTPGLHIERGKA